MVNFYFWLNKPWLRPAWPCVLLCFGNSVNRKLKCYHIWPLYLFYFDGEITALAACVLRTTTKKRSWTFVEEKSASGWPGWRIFWPRNDLAPLLRWRRHWLTPHILLSWRCHMCVFRSQKIVKLTVYSVRYSQQTGVLL